MRVVRPLKGFRAFKKRCPFPFLDLDLRWVVLFSIYRCQTSSLLHCLLLILSRVRDSADVCLYIENDTMVTYRSKTDFIFALDKQFRLHMNDVGH